MKVASHSIRHVAALKAWETRRTPQSRARQSEARSKTALKRWCRQNNWKVVFFEGATGAPRTGIVDAVMVRIAPGKADSIEVRLVQLKGGGAGMSGKEVGRIKRAVSDLSKDWLFAAYDGSTLHLVPDIPKQGAAA